MENEITEIPRTELTAENIPQALNYLINEVAEISAKIDRMQQQLNLDYDRRRPITIEKAAQILSTDERAVRKLVKAGEILYYLYRNKTYFFESLLCSTSGYLC